MYRTLMLAVLLLLCTAWSPALQNPSGDESKSPSFPPGTLQGCLQYENGVYSLLGDDGVKYRLAGSGKLLKPHVSHEVELTGKPSSRSQESTLVGGASSVVQYYVFEVKSVRHVSLNCKEQ
jgi:hypothetical protein